MIKYGNRTATVEQNWNILEINPRTIIFKFDFLGKKSPLFLRSQMKNVKINDEGMISFCNFISKFKLN